MISDGRMDRQTDHLLRQAWRPDRCYPVGRAGPRTLSFTLSLSEFIPNKYTNTQRENLRNSKCLPQFNFFIRWNCDSWRGKALRHSIAHMQMRFMPDSEGNSSWKSTERENGEIERVKERRLQMRKEEHTTQNGRILQQKFRLESIVSLGNVYLKSLMSEWIKD